MIEWDLKDLYSSIEDPQITKDKNTILADIAEFNKYRGKLSSKLKPAIKKYEKILNKLYLLSVYANLLHEKKTNDPKIGRFFAQIQEYAAQAQAQLLWFEIEWLKLNDKTANRLIKENKDYSHFLKHARVFKPHTKSEPEEQILALKAQTSSSAFARMFNDFFSNKKFNGKTYSELTPVLTQHPNRKRRQKAAQDLSAGLKEESKFYAYILNTLILDKKITDQIRNYQYPQQATFLSYEVTPDVVETMTTTIQSRYKIAEKFYQAKAKLLGLKILHEWDRYSVIYPNINPKYSWQQTKEIVLQAFYEFSPIFGNTAKLFFDNGWIDAKITPGKTSGAFCSYTTPSHHPYILMNFTGQTRDVTTLAHELGHGIHGYLARENNLLQAWPSTATAEIASVFAENLVFNKLFKESKNKKHKINLLAEKIQDSFATIFRQNAFYLFESDIHQYYRTKGELAERDFNQLFQKRLQASFGKGLKLTDDHAYWWIPVAHFFNYHFYVFSYAMGETITNALFSQYQKDPKFTDKYITTLRLGGSKSPAEIVKIMGINISDPDFFNQGLDLIEERVKKFINLEKFALRKHSVV